MTAVESVPTVVGLHHCGLTVTDLDASVAWYCRVFGLERVMTEPHEGGMAVVLNRPGTPLFIGLHRHDRNDGARADETVTGLDHLAFHVPERAMLESWVAHLDDLGIKHSDLYETTDPFPYALVVFRDPDNLQLEVIWS
jgi:catechol 2,3-dioxygenase-like lactoylglutathione lyase family enzyme